MILSSRPVRIVIGSRTVEILDQRDEVVLRCVAQHDLAAVKNLRRMVEARIAEGVHRE